MTILFNKALLLAKIEATFDQDPNPDNVNDAFLVINPDFAPDITILERDNVRTSLSNDARAVGRKIGQITFQHEVRNNGDASGATSPRRRSTPPPRASSPSRRTPPTSACST